MHTTGSPNPVPEIISRIKKTSKQDRLDALKYILTGKDETAGTLAETYDFDTHTSGRGYYTGLNSIHTRIGPITGEDDMVRTYLYRKPLNNMSEVTGPDKYGVHEGYVSENYPGRKVPVYELGPVSGSRTVSGDQVLSKSISSGNGDIIGTGLDGKTINYDAAGHIVETGKLATGETVQRQQDIWKFNSRDYMRR
ncbi:MAG: hypothetical protein J6V44_11640 [Methanobrevibacter sp.]|nr:hypothetical protein [Methanobrevibacter sp.]